MNLKNKNKISGRQYKRAVKFSFTFVQLLLLIACAKNSGLNTNAGNGNSAPTSSTAGDPGANNGPVAAAQYLPLVWESSANPERAAWSASAEQLVAQYLPSLDKAKDIATFCPKYSSLNQTQKINLWADLFAADSYFESGWDPANYSVDVGTQNDENTWSVGLLQMSVVDQQNYNLPFGFNFANLQQPADNLQLAIAIMAQQINKYGVVLIKSGQPGLYWSTMNPGGRDDQTAGIVKMTEQLSFCQ